MIEDIMNSRWGGYIVMAVLMGAIALLLRVLYGPRGLFRDPKWDEENQRIRSEEKLKHQWKEERFQLDMHYPPARDISPAPGHRLSLEEHCSLFRHYAASFITAKEEDAPLRLKEVHSLRVFDHAKRIVQSEHFSENIARAGLLAALYHDCGRFPQYRKYRTFADALSVNHARLSLDTLKKEHFLIGEEKEVRSLVQTAVLLHNKSSLPAKLLPEARLVTDMVRDADKLDIISIMVSHFSQALPENDAVFLHVKDSPELCSPEVVQCVLAGRVVSYRELHYVNDFRLLLGTWMHELHFAATWKELQKRGDMEKVLSNLPDTPELRSAVLYLKNLMYSQEKKYSSEAM